MVARWGGVLKGSAAGGGGGGGAGGTLTGAFVDDDFSENNASQLTWTGVNFGTAAANRLIVVAAHSSRNVGPVHVTSMTIGGVAATLVKASNGTLVGVEIWQALVPSGTSGTLVINWSGTVSLGGYGAWSVKTDTQGAQNTGSSSGTSIAATVPASGFAVFAYQGNNVSNDFTSATPSNYTEDYETIFATGSNIMEGGHFSSSVTVDTTTSPSAQEEVLVYASWGP